MDVGMYDELAIEEIAKSKFGLKVDIKQLIVRAVPVSHVGEASVFLTSKKQLYCLITSQGKLNVGHVRTIIARMGLKAELYLPPKGEPDYFERIAYEKFKEVFPGRTNINSDDLAYYRTLASYSPALIQISEVRDGIIYQFDTDAASNWRPIKNFSYRRIRTS